MNKEALIRGLESAHLTVINRLDEVQCPQNWRTNPDKVEASLELTVEEAIILVAIARLEHGFPYMIAALHCLHEARDFADPDLVVDISQQAIVSSLRYSKYIDGNADKDLDLGEIDTPFNRFATILRSIGKIARIKLGVD